MHKIDLATCINALENGKIIVYPTDTLYALGADIYSDAAVKKIYTLKKRPLNNPLPVAVPNFSEMTKIAITGEAAKRLAERFLPGSLTLVLHKKNVGSLNRVTSGLDKVAVRIPDNPIALELLRQFGPLTVTSANIHGKKTPHVINKIQMQFSKEDIAVYLDYGKLEGKPSTIVDLTVEKPQILRKGVITEKKIAEAIKNG